MEGTHDMTALVIAERERQVSVEGYTSDHDDAHEARELRWAAISYASASNSFASDHHWPWPDGFKPSDDYLVNLIKAAALLIAEGDRVLRSRSGDRNG